MPGNVVESLAIAKKLAEESPKSAETVR